jgi:hypothetical protein
MSSTRKTNFRNLKLLSNMKTPILIILLFLTMPCFAEPDGGRRSMRIVFYNVENLLGPPHLSPYRLRAKLVNVSKALLAAGGEQAPAVIGLCEVAGDSLLDALVNRTPLRAVGYRTFVTDGPDRRGINVALLYRRELFRPLSRMDLRVCLPEGASPTRDVLHIAGLTAGGDTLDLLVCHLPSRRGGAERSQPARDAATSRIRQAVDSINALRREPRIVVMGDFNEPSAPIALPLAELPTGATYKYDGAWQRLDRVLVSPSLVDAVLPDSTALPEAGGSGAERGFRVVSADAFRAPFLLSDDPAGGVRPKRTMRGASYEGGFSDHLPIFIECLF